MFQENQDQYDYVSRTVKIGYVFQGLVCVFYSSSLNAPSMRFWESRERVELATSLVL